MRYNFSEKNLGPLFCKDIIKEIKEVIKAGSSFTIIGIPYIGGILFFRYLAMTNLAYFVLLDMHALPSATKAAFFFSLYRELGGNNQNITKENILEKCRERLHILSQKDQKVIILINQINYLKHELRNNLLLNLRTLEDFRKGKIFFIISATKPLHDYTEVSNYEKSVGIASKNIYFHPYSKNDLKKLIAIYPLELRKKGKDLTSAIELSGGHTTLFHFLLKTDYFDKPLADQQIQLHLDQIYQNYSSPQKSQLRKIATGKRVKDLDPFLIKIGLVKQVNDKYELFTPLLRDYILTYIKPKLSKKERKLLALFKSKLGKLVTKDELFQTLWEEKAHEATDWALNSTIYRLRKHPFFQSTGYVIENEKDEGYRMIKES